MNLAYFDNLLAAYSRGIVSDHVHLGLFGNKVEGQTLSLAQELMSLHHIDLLDLKAGDSIVDVGCGLGGTLRWIDAHFEGVQLTGINIDQRQIDAAKGGPWRSIVDFQLSDAADFSDSRINWADRIVSIEAMFHFQNLMGFFSAAARAMRPSGRMVASTILFKDDASPQSVATVCAGFSPWPRPNLKLAEICEQAALAGLKVVQVEDLAPRCLPSFEWMGPACPDEVTDDPVIELRRIFEAGKASYPVLVLLPA